MMKGQFRHCHYVRHLNLQQFDTVQPHLLGYERVKRLAQAQFAYAQLDRHFPQTGHAEERLFISVLNERPGSWAEAGATANEPQETMRVQEQSHGMYSPKSSSGASKSSAMTTKPLALPN